MAAVRHTNQLLAGIALCICTGILVKQGKVRRYRAGVHASRPRLAGAAQFGGAGSRSGMINSIRRSIPINSWSTEDIRLLRQLAVAGAPLETIAVTLRRTRSAIRNKATMHGISLRRCGDTLSSEAVSA